MSVAPLLLGGKFSLPHYFSFSEMFTYLFCFTTQLVIIYKQEDNIQLGGISFSFSVIPLNVQYFSDFLIWICRFSFLRFKRGLGDVKCMSCVLSSGHAVLSEGFAHKFMPKHRPSVPVTSGSELSLLRHIGV